MLHLVPYGLASFSRVTQACTLDDLVRGAYHEYPWRFSLEDIAKTTNRKRRYLTGQNILSYELAIGQGFDAALPRPESLR